MGRDSWLSVAKTRQIFLRAALPSETDVENFVIAQFGKKVDESQ